jgi:hypothetical protein
MTIIQVRLDHSYSNKLLNFARPYSGEHWYKLSPIIRETSSGLKVKSESFLSVALIET